MKNRIFVITAAFLVPLILNAQDGIKAGTFIVEPATLINLGFEWNFTGDANRNAIVETAYRVSGTKNWKEALPLLRIGGERVFRKVENLDYTVPDLFAGSILDLLEDTEYECRFTMKDPDGATGETVRTVKVRTRAEPKASTEGRTLHVYPVDWKGKKEQPSFLGLKAAYYGSGLGDWSVVSERKAKPGDIILMHAGMYKADRLNYVEPNGIPFDGTYVLTLKGTVDKPIVIRGAGDGETIIDGAGAPCLFDVTASENNIFENLTIRDADIAFMAGLKDVIGAKNLTIRNCRIEDVGIAITTENAGSKNFYIADNIIIGREDRYRVRGWASPGIYPPSQLIGYNAIKVYGSGHVICYNSVAFFHDGIDISTYGTPEMEKGLKPVAIDIYNNDIHLVVDDFIEADGGVHNIRVMRNRGVNAGQCGLSAQPVFGGPAYFIRNVLYNIPNGVALKFMAKPAGLYVLHNTIISENRNVETFSNAHFRNNLFLGINADQRPVTAFPMATAYSTYDYDGYRPNKTGGNQYTWISPATGQLRDYDVTAKEGKQYLTLKSFSDESGLEKHGVEIDYDIFTNMHAPDPAKHYAIYHATDIDFTLNPKGRAVDKGIVLPNINDGFKGIAPDLGAIEAGEPVPVYGARGIGNQSFYR
ncbi:MAG: hypothetical protein ABI675_04930 [Chitinophagaceae bacterium]